MTRESGPKAAPQIAADKRDQGQISSNADLERRRAQRDAEAAIGKLRELLSMFDRGEIELDEFAYGLGLLGSRLGKLACSGVLAA
jgi:hypothetical protein